MTTINHTIAEGTCTTCGETEEYLFPFVVEVPVNGGMDWQTVSRHATLCEARAEVLTLNAQAPAHPYQVATYPY